MPFAVVVHTENVADPCCWLVRDKLHHQEQRRKISKTRHPETPCLSTGAVKREDQEWEASLGYTARLSQTQKGREKARWQGTAKIS